MIPPVVLLGAKHLRAGVEYTLLDYVEEFQAIQWTLNYLETKGIKSESDCQISTVRQQ